MNGLVVSERGLKRAHIILIEMDPLLIKVKRVLIRKKSQKKEYLMMYSALMENKNQR